MSVWHVLPPNYNKLPKPCDEVKMLDSLCVDNILCAYGSYGRLMRMEIWSGNETNSTRSYEHRRGFNVRGCCVLHCCCTYLSRECLIVPVFYMIESYFYTPESPCRTLVHFKNPLITSTAPSATVPA